MDPDTIADTISQVAAEPKSATSDGQIAENQPIPDLLKLQDRALASAALASGGSGWGLCRAARFVPRGAGGEPTT